MASDHMVFDDEAQSVSLPTTEGSVGILAHHSNIIMAVVPGEITYRAANGDEETVIVSDGLLKVERRGPERNSREQIPTGISRSPALSFRGP